MHSRRITIKSYKKPELEKLNARCTMTYFFYIIIIALNERRVKYRYNIVPTTNYNKTRNIGIPPMYYIRKNNSGTTSTVTVVSIVKNTQMRDGEDKIK